MKKGQATMNGEAVALERPLKVVQPIKDATSETPVERGEFRWWERIQLAYGVRTMANRPQTPSIPLNVTTLGTWVIIIATILGGFAWTWKQGRDAGYEQRDAQAQIEQLMQQLKQNQIETNRAEADAAEAKKFGIYAAAGSDANSGHKPNQKEKK